MKLLLELLVVAGVAVLSFTQQTRALTSSSLSPALEMSAAFPRMVVGDTRHDLLGRAWQPDEWLTTGLQFTVRGKEALGWSLGIEESGFHSPAIRETYQKVLTIVNSLFIVGLLAIAGLWLFNAFVPRPGLRRVMTVYAVAVVFVNFALPFNQLLIDGSNVLQKAFLSREGENRLSITDVVQTPSYADARVYAQVDPVNAPSMSQEMTLEAKGLPGAAVLLGRLQPPSPTEPSLPGAPPTPAREGQEIQMQSGSPVTLTVTHKTPQAAPEASFFALAMLILTGTAYFALAVLFVARLVILWTLLVLSPLLLFLAIFEATRGYFYNWLSLYGRWLLIGPLTALGITLVLNVWKVSGLPITSGYSTEASFGVLSNVAFYLPGQKIPNTLSTTPQMMEYLIFLIMLYLPLFFAFILTRQKHVTWVLNALGNGMAGRRRDSPSPVVFDPEEKPGSVTEITKNVYETNLIQKFRGLFDRPISDLTQTVLPTENPEPRGSGIETAFNLLPQQIARMNLNGLLALVSGHEDSRRGRTEAIHKMAFPEHVTDHYERHKVETATAEIKKRADQGDAVASAIVNEISEYRTQNHSTTVNETTTRNERVEVIPPVATGGIQKKIETEKAPPNKGGAGGLKLDPKNSGLLEKGDLEDFTIGSKELNSEFAVETYPKSP